MRLVPAGDLESANPVMGISWCIGQKDLAYLKSAKAENIHVLIVTAYENEGGEDRNLVPIDQVMEFLEFRRPGHHVVFARLVWGESAYELRKTYLGLVRRRVYVNEVLGFGHTELLNPTKFDTEMEVVVPREHFPKEPPELVKRMANFGFSYPCYDQCQLRRRLLGAPIKLLFAAIWAVVTTALRIVVAVWLGGILALRNVHYETIFHPWRFNVSDVYSRWNGQKPSMNNSWVLHNKPQWNDCGGGSRGWYFVLLHPIVYLISFGFIYLTKSVCHISFFAAVVLVGQGIAQLIWWMRKFLFVVAAVIAAGISLLYWISKERKVSPKERAERERLQKRNREKKYQELYALVGCKTKPFVPEVSNLPPERRTVHLRFHDLKAKVCRPFAN